MPKSLKAGACLPSSENDLNGLEVIRATGGPAVNSPGGEMLLPSILSEHREETQPTASRHVAAHLTRNREAVF